MLFRPRKPSESERRLADAVVKRLVAEFEQDAGTASEALTASERAVQEAQGGLSEAGEGKAARRGGFWRFCGPPGFFPLHALLIDGEPHPDDFRCD
jgi:hypothetical protein